MRRACLLILVLSLAAAPAGCGDSTPSEPSPQGPNLSGAWSGNLAVQGTPAQMTWTLSQTGTAVSGPVLIRLASGIVLLNGALTGTLNGSVLTYTVVIAPNGIPTQPACSGQVGGIVTATDDVRTLAGSFNVVSSTCVSPLTSGAITLARQ
jgi:hypothetical protein